MTHHPTLGRRWQPTEISPRYRAPDDVPGPEHPDFLLSMQQYALLKSTVTWTEWRAAYRSRMIAAGVIDRGFRSVFEGDQILSMIGLRFIADDPITLKELASYFDVFITEPTVSRHVSDMQAMGLIERVRDEKDRRRILLILTKTAFELAREYLQSQVDFLARAGFVYDPNVAASRQT